MSTRHIRQEASVPEYTASPLQEAVIATTPGTVDDELWVLIQDGPSQQRVVVHGWAAHPTDTGIVLPARGDRGMVALGFSGYWLLAWETA